MKASFKKPSGEVAALTKCSEPKRSSNPARVGWQVCRSGSEKRKRNVNTGSGRCGTKVGAYASNVRQQSAQRIQRKRQAETQVIRVCKYRFKAGKPGACSSCQPTCNKGSKNQGGAGAAVVATQNQLPTNAVLLTGSNATRHGAGEESSQNLNCLTGETAWHAADPVVCGEELEETRHNAQRKPTAIKRQGAQPAVAIKTSAAGGR